MDLGEIAARLSEERERLGRSKGDFAMSLGLTREGLRKIEAGSSQFKVDVLSKAAALGVDVQYVLTGIRSKNLDSVAKEVGYERQAIHGNVSGGVGFAGPGSNVRIINTQQHITRTKVETKPGVEHITAVQRAALKALVDQVVETEAALKSNPKTYRAVWSSLNAHCSVPNYSLIAVGDYEKAEKYLRQWLGRLSSMPSAALKDGDNWRRRHYAYIKANSREAEDAAALQAYLARNFKVDSIRDLTNDQLERVYRYVAGRRNRKRS